MKGYVYVLSNPSMPGIYKIGRSVRGGVKRSKELYSGSSGIPTPFQIEFEIYCDDCVEVERLAHEKMSRYRITEKREFFQCDREDAVEKVIMSFGETQGYVYGLKEEFISLDAIQKAVFDNGGYKHEAIIKLHPFILLAAYEHALTELDPVFVVHEWNTWINEGVVDHEEENETPVC